MSEPPRADNRPGTSEPPRADNQPGTSDGPHTTGSPRASGEARESRTDHASDEARQSHTNHASGETRANDIVMPDDDDKHHRSDQPTRSTSHQPNGSVSMSTSAGIQATDVLARRYGALLRAYPKGWREQRGDEMLGTLLDAAEPGRRRPSVRESVSIVVQGLRERLGLRRRRSPGAVWSEGLRIGALLVLGEAFAEALVLLYENTDLPAHAAAWYGAAVPFGGAAMAALVMGRTVVAAVLTGVWAVLPTGQGELPWTVMTALLVLTALSLADRGRQRISVVWLGVVPVTVLLWFGHHLLTGGFFQPAGALVYPFALLLAVTAVVLVDPRLPVAVACLSVVVMLQSTLHVAGPLYGSATQGELPVHLRPQTTVFAAITVVLLTIGYLRARRPARI